MSRSDKVIKNVSTGLINKAAIMLLSFATKTIFIKQLGVEYSGVNSLYSNILSVLALAELGLGNVLMFYLYDAIVKNDTNKINALTLEFKKIYNIIIICVSIVGIIIVPFLGTLVKSSLPNDEIVIYYLLYLLNSIASYFVVYRTMVIRANQKDYILNNCNTVSSVIMHLFQIIYLLLFHDFLGFLIIQVVCTIANNYVQNTIALNKYPYLKNKRIDKEIVIDKKNMFDNVKATFLFKISDTILDQTDNIIISIMFGTAMVGYYTNYYMVILYLVQIAAIIVNGSIASFGNLYNSGEQQKSYVMIKCIMFFFSVFGTWCVACYSSVIHDFIIVWVGKQYLMDNNLVAAILIVFYLRMITNTVWICRSTMGIFKEVQYVNLIAAILNIILSVIMGYYFGVAGIIVSTAISRFITSFWYEGKVVFLKLGKDPKEYLCIQLRSALATGTIVYISLIINSNIYINGIIGIVVKIVICTIVTVILEILLNRNTNEYMFFFQKFQNMLKIIKNRNI